MQWALCIFHASKIILTIRLIYPFFLTSWDQELVSGEEAPMQWALSIFHASKIILTIRLLIYPFFLTSNDNY